MGEISLTSGMSSASVLCLEGFSFSFIILILNCLGHSPARPFISQLECKERTQVSVVPHQPEVASMWFCYQWINRSFKVLLISKTNPFVFIRNTWERTVLVSCSVGLNTGWLQLPLHCPCIKETSRSGKWVFLILRHSGRHTPTSRDFHCWEQSPFTVVAEVPWQSLQDPSTTPILLVRPGFLWQSQMFHSIKQLVQ